MRNTGVVTTDKDDDEALHWAGESDPTHADAPPGNEPVPATETAEPKAGLSPAILIAFGILAGVYLLYTIGWVITTQRNPVMLPGILDQVMFQTREVLAIAAPAIWFVSTLLLTRGRKPLEPLLWLAAGVIVLVPLPFVLGV